MGKGTDESADANYRAMLNEQSILGFVWILFTIFFMVLLRLGLFSAQMFAITLMEIGFAFRYRTRSLRTSILLIVSSLATLVVLGFAAANAQKPPGSSLREIDLSGQIVFFLNVCLWCLAMVLPYRIERFRARRRIRS